MARNGAGTYSLPAGNPVTTGTTISSTWANNTLSDIATTLTASLAYDGQTNPVSNLPMAGYIHTGVGNAINRNNYAVAGQVQDGTYSTLSSVSGTDTITASGAINLTTYVSGQFFNFIATGANTTTSVTLNINGIGAKNVTKNGSTALAVGEIKNGQMVTVIYDGTQFQLLNPAISIPANVSSFQTSLNGLTPSTSTTGAVTLAGTLGVSSGGTGLTSAGTSGQVPVSNGTNFVMGLAAGTLLNIQYFTVATATVTLTIAAPCVVTFAAYNLPQNGSQIVFTTTGALPTGITAGTTYYVINASGTTCNISATKGGSAITTSGTQSGTHTAQSGTYTATANTASVVVEVQGGGGGGSASGGSAGGSAGGYARKRLTSGFNSQTITVGAGGAGGSSAVGTAGNNSSFGALVSATGGGASGTGAAGGIGSGGDINLSGGSSGTSSNGGGVSLFGGGGGGVSNTGTARIGSPNTGAGGGGAGGSITLAAGGGSGIVIVYEYS